ncbi:prepilin peptidase [Polymorphobacter fuscus]|nr:A24 family peptidase [Polymorphobacter fuscus]NJC07129.1 prepilin signal peptidase PulO-like enzyme (type II secretory pathway) [Polymorphobacter fuscus]
MLLALLVLDVEYFWLPDRLTVPLAAMGLAAGIWLPPSVPDRLIGAAAGFASLAGIAYAYRVMTGRVGLGGGDPRLFAAIGAWLGWVALPFVLLLAASFGLALVAYDRLRGRAITRHSRIPLGALLAAAAWLLWVPGPFSVWER